METIKSDTMNRLFCVT